MQRTAIRQCGRIQPAAAAIRRTATSATGVRQLLRTDRSARPAGLQLHHRRGVHPLLEKVRHVQGPRLRGEFWWWVLCTFIIQIAFAVIFAVLGAIIDSNTANGMRSFVNTIWALATIVPSLALSVRRLHDTNKAGTTLVILYAIDFIGGVLLSVGLVMTGLGAISVIGGGSSSTGVAGILLLIIGFIACLATSIVLIVLMAKKTDPAGARFDDPAAGNGYAPAPGMPPTATAQYAPNGTPAPVADPYAAAVPTPTADPYTAAAPAPAMPAPTPAMPTADPYGAPTPAPAATNTPYGNPYGAPYGTPTDQYAAPAMPAAPAAQYTPAAPATPHAAPAPEAPSMPSMPPLPTVPEQSTQLDQTQFDRPTFGNDSQGQTPYGSDDSDDSDDPTAYGNIQH
ncbi:MAG: DUF805 domain-containing protein [Bifidobacterium dentium]